MFNSANWSSVRKVLRFPGAAHTKFNFKAFSHDAFFKASPIPFKYFIGDFKDVMIRNSRFFKTGTVYEISWVLISSKLSSLKVTS